MPKFTSAKVKKAKWSKYPNDKPKLESHLNINNSEIFDTQAWTQKQKCFVQDTA